MRAAAFRFCAAGGRPRSLVDQVGVAAARQQLLGGWQQGLWLVDFEGHGSTDTWRGGLFSTADASGLANGPLPFVVSMTCLNGFFQDVQGVCLAKGVLVEQEDLLEILLKRTSEPFAGLVPERQDPEARMVHLLPKGIQATRGGNSQILSVCVPSIEMIS